MDTEALAERARGMSREEFAAKHGGLYLVLGELSEKAIGFETAVVTFNEKGRKQLQLPADFEVLKLEKARGNPYPDRISVGRARNCDLVMRDPSVSKLHAHFRLGEGGRLDLVDLGSQNGTRVNARALKANDAEWVGAGDTVTFGAVNAKIVDAEALFDLLNKD